MPGPEIVHPVPIEDLETWTRSLVLTLLGDVHGEEFAYGLERRRAVLESGRTWGVRDRGHWVATLATLERTITVPGPDGGTAELTADALTAVTVGATHRRRGLLRTMLEQSLQEAADRGDALSMLVAAEWPIYGRFGYAPAVDGASYRLYPRRARGVAGADPRSVRPADPDEIARIAPEVFARARRLRPGQVQRLEPWWTRVLGRDGALPAPSVRASWFVHEGPDGPDGVLAWRTTRDFDLVGPLGAIAVPELFAASRTAYRDLWGYLAGMDAVEEIELDQRALDEPVRLLLGDGRALETRSTFDFVWLRLLDVPAALSARAYAVPGSLVLDVVDTAGPGYAAGRYELGFDGHTSTCSPTAAAPDLRVDQRCLAMTYLGGHRLGEVAITGGVEELRPGALAQADLMFSTPLTPWNQTGF